jgi:hypothetical protein
MASSDDREHPAEPDAAVDDRQAMPAGTPILAALSENSERGARLRQGWRASAERRRVRLGMGMTVATAVVVAVLVGLISHSLQPRYERNAASPWLNGLGSLAAGLYVSAFFGMVYRRQQRRAWYDRAVVLKQYEEVSRAESEVSEDGQLDLMKLWAVTQKRLDYYHQLATGQAEKSFNYGLIAAGVGFIVLVGSAVAAAAGESTAASISAGLVGVAGGGLAGYIGRTFMRLQESAAVQLRAYFSQPLEFSRLLGAERLLEQLDPGARQLATQEIIRAIAASVYPGRHDAGELFEPNVARQPSSH